MPRLLIITEQTVCKTLIKDLSKQKCSDLIVQTKLIEQVQLTCNSKEDNKKDKNHIITLIKYNVVIWWPFLLLSNTTWWPFLLLSNTTW